MLLILHAVVLPMLVRFRAIMFHAIFLMPSSFHTVIFPQLHPKWQSGMLSFSRNLQSLNNREWLIQLPLILVVAAAAGALGALFNALRRWLWRWRASRRRHALRCDLFAHCYHTRVCIPPLHAPCRVLEAFAVVTLTVTWMFVSSRFFGVCRLVPQEWQQGEYGAWLLLLWMFASLWRAFVSLWHAFVSLWRAFVCVAVCVCGQCMVLLQCIVLIVALSNPSLLGATGLQYNCPSSHYNDLASLYFSQPTETIRKVRVPMGGGKWCCGCFERLSSENEWK